MIDVGSMGRFSDGGIFTDSHFYNKLQNNELRLPPDEPLYEGGLPQPYVFIGDCAFPLMTHLLKPYPDHESTPNGRKCVWTCRSKIGRTGLSKLVIDNDAGGDDAIAVFLGLLNEKYFDGPKVIALTTVNGNTTENNVFINNQKILQVAKRQDIPIYRGARDTLLKTHVPVNYYGIDGLGDCEEEPEGLVPAQEGHAVLALIEMSKAHAGELSVLCLGPLTNVTLAIRLDPDFIKRLAHLHIGAGHIHSKQYSTPEFNALVDVEAYHIVLDSATSDKVTVLPFSQVKAQLDFSKSWRENMLGSFNTEIVKAINKYERLALNKSDRWQTLDPAVVAIAIKEDLVEEYIYSRNSICLHGEQRGIVVNEFVEKENANIRIAHKLKREDYEKFLLSVFCNE